MQQKNWRAGQGKYLRDIENFCNISFAMSEYRIKDLTERFWGLANPFIFEFAKIYLKINQIKINQKKKNLEVF